MSRPNDDRNRPHDIEHRRLRRVRIEEHQEHTIEQVRGSLGYADRVDLHGHDHATFQMIN
jgi:hypothetical protein